MKQAAGESLSALVLGVYETDRLLVRDVFEKSNWRLFEAADRPAAIRCLTRNPVQVVIAAHDLPEWNWQNVLADTRLFAPAPQLIVAARHADAVLWAEVLNVGAYDLLAQPFDRDEVERVVAAAGRRFNDTPTGKRKALTAR